MEIDNPWLMAAASAIVVGTVMFALWLLSLRHRNFSYVDIGWSANFALLALLHVALAPGWLPRKLLIGTLFAIHGLRLALHLWKRIAGQPEEGRYVQLRREWGASGNLNLKFLAFFEFQAALNVFLSLPLLLACMNRWEGWLTLEGIGAAICIVGLLGESLADAQLAAFKRDPANKGAVCDVGLWRYSRHPNYFFEWVIWIGYAVFASASGPYGWLAVAAPLLMLHFLLNVTGVKATEEQALRSKGERYRAYQARTSAFVPWIPRKVP